MNMNTLLNKLRRTAGALVLGIVAAISVAPVAHAGALLDAGENQVIDATFRGQTYAPPTTPHWALGTNACSDSASPTEPSGNGYARVAYAASLANWAGTQSAGSTTASSGTGGTTSNNAAITLPTSTGAWASGANLVSVWMMTASTGGTASVCITLTTPVAVTGAGFTLSFPAGSLSFQADN